MKKQILILGASYGSLLGTKLALGGHDVKLVCLPAEAEAINSLGVRVRMPVKGREGLTEVHSWKLPGKISADGPARSSRRTTTWSRSRCRSRNTARRACASCSTRWPRRKCRACRS